MFNLLLGFFVGSVLCGYKYRDFIDFITSILVFIFCICLFIFRSYVAELIGYELKSFILIVWGIMLSVLIFIYFRLYLIVGGFSNFFSRLCLIAVCAMWILMAVRIASSESLKLINNIYSNGVVLLKDSKNDWGIVEMNGDKILLIGKAEKGLKYKLVEYKEVLEIKAVK
ncbi:membrane hypothetical protein [Acinetobacter sp. 8I-beige]|nr:membrane hypothetical protein [Acinetobacter sp. 8I-beige]